MSGFGDDVQGKGFHIDYFEGNRRTGELTLVPVKLKGGGYEIQVSNSYSSGRVQINNGVLREVKSLLRNTKQVLDRAKRMIDLSIEYGWADRLEQGEMFIEIFSASPPSSFTVVKGP